MQMFRHDTKTVYPTEWLDLSAYGADLVLARMVSGGPKHLLLVRPGHSLATDPEGPDARALGDISFVRHVPDWSKAETGSRKYDALYHRPIADPDGPGTVEDIGAALPLARGIRFYGPSHSRDTGGGPMPWNAPGVLWAMADDLVSHAARHGLDAAHAVEETISRRTRPSARAAGVAFHLVPGAPR